MFPCRGLFAEVLSCVNGDKPEKRRWQKYTLAVVCSTSSRHTRMRLTQTFEPLKLPSCTSQEPPNVDGVGLISRGGGGRKYDLGRIPLAPHILLSSRRHFRETWLERSGRLRAYAGLSEEREGTARQRTSSRYPISHTESSCSRICSHCTYSSP